ncbi:peptide deformylase [Streptomyces sp. NPDC126514]|uniref:peptide deformylase n=1 Tax=Streptomyces sp. NPDC126514 TaxID=3155210 RepID=UPI0033211283
MSEYQSIPPVSSRPVRLQGAPVDSYPALSREALAAEVRGITVIGETVLHRPCTEVTAFGTKDLSQLIDDMFLTMHIAEGAGLAANQVGVDMCLFVYDCVDDEGVRHVGHICNPVLDAEYPAGRHLLEEAEGCLSVPGASHVLARPAAATVRGVDKEGKPLQIQGTGYFARCLQHETDHLGGTLYVDRLTKRQRQRVLREMEQEREEVFARRAARAAELGK